MSSSIIGRTACPECDFKAAHVKQGPKSIYRYCPECGSQYFPRNERQLDLLKTKMRPVVDPATPTDTVAGVASTDSETLATGSDSSATDVAATPSAGTTTKRRGLFA
jgi:predicted  nucleic acid-binding Zn-ribbon protein